METSYFTMSKQAVLPEEIIRKLREDHADADDFFK